MPDRNDPPTCPYCGGTAKLVPGTSIDPHRPDLAPRKFWSCKPCEAYVGVHRNSPRMVPLGRLADAELRREKRRAHAAFDPLWLRKMTRDECSPGEARSAGYKWLARELGIPPRECHIGWMDAETCRRVVEICRAVAGGGRLSGDLSAREGRGTTTAPPEG